METSSQQENSNPNNVTGSCLLDLLRADNSTSWSCRSRTSSTGPQGKLEGLLSQSGNRVCADCGSPDPKWVSTSLGVFICIKCSGIHRSLGVHISKVVSVKLDEWTDEQVDCLADMGGNTAANLKYEAFIPEHLEKPKPDSSIEERSDFIRRKYELQQFLYSDSEMSCPYPPYPRMSSSSSHCSSSSSSANERKLNEKQQNCIGIHGLGQAFRNSWRRKESEQKSTKKNNTTAGMIEFIGLIKVNVVRGTNLAVRDVMTSDPYVIISLGNQSVKTRVIKNNLNPVWNERLMLSIPEHIPPLKLLVYDKDTFSTDDFMGEAEIDIQALVSAAKAYENSTINESTQLGKWIASKDNTLQKDSVITLLDGKVKQEIILRLQNVERGILEIELECVPLSQ